MLIEIDYRPIVNLGAHYFRKSAVIDHAFELSKGTCRGFANDRRGGGPG
jgi:hypothetical protein